MIIWKQTLTFSLRSLFLLPFWFLQLFTGAKSFRDNGLLRSKRLNRFGLHSGRARISHELAWWRSRRLAKSISSDDRSEEHTSELQSLMRISYAVFCLKKKKN